jgi:hypothetical protein
MTAYQGTGKQIALDTLGEAIRTARENGFTVAVDKFGRLCIPSGTLHLFADLVLPDADAPAPREDRKQHALDFRHMHATQDAHVEP